MKDYSFSADTNELGENLSCQALTSFVRDRVIPRLDLNDGGELKSLQDASDYLGWIAAFNKPELTEKEYTKTRSHILKTIKNISGLDAKGLAKADSQKLGN